MYSYKWSWLTVVELSIIPLQCSFDNQWITVKIIRTQCNLLKMLGLYLDTLIMGQNFCNMYLVYEMNLRCKSKYKFLRQIMCFGQKSKNTTTIKQKIEHKNPCRNRKSNRGPLAPQMDALPLHHRVNWEYWLFSSYLTVSTQWVKT